MVGGVWDRGFIVLGLRMRPCEGSYRQYNSQSLGRQGMLHRLYQGVCHITFWIEERMREKGEKPVHVGIVLSRL